MKIKFTYHKQTKRRWRYKAASIDDAQCLAIQKAHTELILYKKLFPKPPATITIEI